MAVESPPTPATGLYCYGVTAARDAKPFRRGLGDASVEPVVHEDIAALTSVVPPGKVRARRRDLMAHVEVLGAAFEHGAVLPLRFGIVFDDEQALVRDFLAPRHDGLAKLLRELANRVELRVTAHYREQELLGEIVRQNRRIGELREATRNVKGPHPALIELGELVSAEMRARTVRDSRALLGQLEKHSLRYEVGDEPIEYEVLRGSFLVERKRVPDFDAAVERFAADQAGRVDVKLVGPLPPHSFVELTHGGGS